MIQGASDGPIANDGALQRLLLGGLRPAPPVGPSHAWVDPGPPGASTRKAHAACSSDCGPHLVRMIQGASDCPIANDGALQRLLVGGLGPAPRVDKLAYPIIVKKGLG